MTHQDMSYYRYRKPILIHVYGVTFQCFTFGYGLIRFCLRMRWGCK